MAPNTHGYPLIRFLEPVLYLGTLPTIRTVADYAARVSGPVTQTASGVSVPSGTLGPMPALSEAVLGLVVRRMHLLADPLRIRLLLALQEGESSVQELADALDTEHRNASYNLNAMYREGVLTRRREGKQVLYSLADFTACRLIGQAAESVAAQVEELSDLVLESD